MESIKTQDGTAKPYDPGASVFFVHEASDRYFQLICCHGQMILNGSALAPSFGCAVLFWLLSSLCLPVVGLKWMFMCWGRGLKEAYLPGDKVCLGSSSSPFLFHVLKDISHNASQKGHLTPVHLLREVVHCWSSLFILVVLDALQ